MPFQKLETDIPDLYVINPDVFGDDRGFFMETFNERSFEDIGLGHLEFVQDNLSYSRKGTIRGMHFQGPPHAQGKLVTVLLGAVLDVVIDIRKSSATYGKVMAFELNDQTRQMLYVPEGLAHGFQVLSDECMFMYKCTSNYNKPSEGSIFWNDPALNMPWRDIPPVVSAKDEESVLFADFESPFL